MARRVVYGRNMGFKRACWREQVMSSVASSARGGGCEELEVEDGQE